MADFKWTADKREHPPILTVLKKALDECGSSSEVVAVGTAVLEEPMGSDTRKEAVKMIIDRAQGLRR